MNFEILCTGDELLTGLTVDTNSAFLAGRLLDMLGLRVQRTQIVGDIREDIVEALRAISQRADAAVVCGGLGPTEDDFTAECAASTAGVPLVEDLNVVESLKRRFEKRGIVLTKNNFRQAQVPQGAEVVHNAVGTAPMFVLRIGSCDFFFLPGVPKEFKYLVEHEVLPRLEQRLALRGKRVFRRLLLLKTIGLPESHLDEKVKPLLARHPQVVFGFRTHAPENHLKLLAEGNSPEEAENALEKARAEARSLLSPWIFGEDDETLAGNLGRLLVEGQQTVAVAESCTGGLVSQLLTEPPGATQWFVGGAVTYLESMKEKWANVRHESLLEHTAVSEEVALEMARGIRLATKASIGLSVTGVAGPSGGTPDTPVGTVFCAFSSEKEDVFERHLLVGDRSRIRLFAAAALLNLLRRNLC